MPQPPEAPPLRRSSRHNAGVNTNLNQDSAYGSTSAAEVLNRTNKWGTYRELDLEMDTDLEMGDEEESGHLSLLQKILSQRVITTPEQYRDVLKSVKNSPNLTLSQPHLSKHSHSCHTH